LSSSAYSDRVTKIVLTGSFAARAVDLSSVVTTDAEGDATGTNAAVGASVAVVVVAFLAPL